jgi:hypothetical protein
MISAYCSSYSEIKSISEGWQTAQSSSTWWDDRWQSQTAKHTHGHIVWAVVRGKCRETVVPDLANDEVRGPNYFVWKSVKVLASCWTPPFIFLLFNALLLLSRTYYFRFSSLNFFLPSTASQNKQHTNKFPYTWERLTCCTLSLKVSSFIRIWPQI